jgi:putative acetyltransferase
MTLISIQRESISQANEHSKIEVVRVTCETSENPIFRQGVTELFRLYFEELLQLGCDLGFQSFQNEWVDLPGLYDFNKRGGLFVAVPSGISSPQETSQILGCVAVRFYSETCGEMKRMFVRKEFRGIGIGRRLTEAIIHHAWSDECRYSELKLDSLERLDGAIRLYENFGFQRISPYCSCPEVDHVCMSKLKT